MNTQKNKNFLVGIVGLIFLAMVAVTLMGTEDESVENQIEIEVAKEVDVEKVKEFEINIVNRKMTLDPPLISVEVGNQVLLNIKSDENLRFHIHEYDHEIMLMADEVRVLSFSATLPGRFDIEIHSGEDDMGDMGDMNMDLSNAKISIESVMVMDNMATVSILIFALLKSIFMSPISPISSSPECISISNLPGSVAEKLNTLTSSAMSIIS
jgi:hypothetical protein